MTITDRETVGKCGCKLQSQKRDAAERNDAGRGSVSVKRIA